MPQKEPKKAEAANMINLSADALSKMIDEEIAKREEERYEIEAGKKDTHLIGAYRERTMLTDEDFISNLVKWHVTVEMAGCLSDQHAKLSREKLWEYLRNNFKPARKGR